MHHLVRIRRLATGAAFAATIAVASAQAYQTEMQTWIAQDALNPPPADALLFVGSSTIRRCEILARDFADYPVIQRGFGGSQMSDLNAWVGQIVLPYDPAAVVVFEGTNDIAAGKSAQTVFQDYLQFVQLVHTGQDPSRPPIPIYYVSITPTPARWALWPVADQANQLIAAHAQTDPSLFYIDTASAFLATGSPPAVSLFVSDNLHQSPSGYALWSGVVQAAVRAGTPSTRTPQANPLHPAVGARIRVDLGPSNPQDGNHTPSPDFFGHHWNNWHDVDGGVGILAGQSLGDLRTIAGAPTGIDLVIAGGFQANGILNGGLTNPSSFLLGDLAVPTATHDYFYCDNGDAPGGFTLTGLEPRFEYRLRVFASRNTSQVRVTRVRASNGQQHQVVDLTTSGPGSGSAGDGNDDDFAVLSRLTADRFGQLFVDLERLAGDFAYANLLELEVTHEIVELPAACNTASPPLSMSHPHLGAAWSFAAAELQPGTLGLVALSFTPPTGFPAFACTVFLDPLQAIEVMPLAGGPDGAWTGSINLPLVPGFAGAPVTVQAVALDFATASGLTFSNGLRSTLQL